MPRPLGEMVASKQDDNNPKFVPLTFEGLNLGGKGFREVGFCYIGGE